MLAKDVYKSNQIKYMSEEQKDTNNNNNNNNNNNGDANKTAENK